MTATRPPTVATSRPCFATRGYVYVVSMHVERPYDSAEKVTDLLRRTVAGLVPLQPAAV